MVVVVHIVCALIRSRDSMEKDLSALADRSTIAGARRIANWFQYLPRHTLPSHTHTFMELIAAKLTLEQFYSNNCVLEVFAYATRDTVHQRRLLRQKAVQACVRITTLV